MKTHLFFVIFLWLAGVDSVFAGKYAAEFLKIGVSPRAAGLGGAFVAIPKEGTGFLWNPAAVAGAGKEGHLFSAAQFGGFSDPLGRLDHFGVTLPIRQAALAFNYIRFGVDDIPIYPELRGENIAQRLRDPALRPDGKPSGYFGDVEQAFVVTFAKNTRSHLDLGWLYKQIAVEIPWGVNLKILRSRLGQVTASGLGLDAGFQIRVGLAEFFDLAQLGKLNFGFTWKNLTQSSLTWSTHHSDVIGSEILWGMVYVQPLEEWKSQFCVTFQHSTTEKPAFGLEWSVKNRLRLRLGSQDKHLTLGAGLAFWRIEVGYALETGQLNPSHRVGISYYFREAK